MKVAKYNSCKHQVYHVKDWSMLSIYRQIHSFIQLASIYWQPTVFHTLFYMPDYIRIVNLKKHNSCLHRGCILVMKSR